VPRPSEFSNYYLLLLHENIFIYLGFEAIGDGSSKRINPIIEFI